MSLYPRRIHTASHSVCVTAGSIVGTITRALSTDVNLIVNSIQAANTITREAGRTISTAILKTVGMSMMQRTGGSGSQSTDWISETSIQSVLSTQGCKRSHTTVITMEARAGSLSNTITFDTAAISSMRQANAGERVQHAVIMHGSGVGTCSLTPVVRIGHTHCEETVWTSDTTVIAHPAHSISSSRLVMVTSGHGVGSTTGMVSVDTGVVSKSIVSNLVLPGGGSITVMGSGLAVHGHSESVRVGLTSSEATIWRSESSVASKTPEGRGRTWRVMLTIGSEMMSLSEALSYGNPLVTRTMVSNAMPSGQRVLLIIGDSFSERDASMRGQIGTTSCPASLWVSETSLLCTVAEGRLATQAAAVTLGIKFSAGSETVSYDLPSISWARASNLAPVQGRGVRVRGSGMGKSGLSGASRHGSTACESTVWLSDTMLLSLPPAHTMSRSVHVAISIYTLVGSHSSAFTYDGFEFADEFLQRIVRKNNAPSAAFRASASIHGVALNLLGATASVRIGSTGCQATLWASDSVLSCAFALSAHGSKPVVVTAGHVIGSMSSVFSLDVGELRSCSNAGPRGRFAVRGDGFTKLDASPACRVGHSQGEMTRWISETSLQSNTLSGGVRTLRVALTVGKQVASITAALSYDAPVITSAKRGNSAPRFASLNLVGAGFSRWDGTPAARFGGTRCLVTVWVSASSIKCRAPDGMGRTVSAALTLGREISASGSATVSYDAPSVAGLSRSNASPYTGVAVSAIGAGMGMYCISPAVVHSLTACQASVWASDSAISALKPSGHAGTAKVLVTLAYRTGTLTETFSMSRPLLAFNTEYTNVRTQSGLSILLYATNFGALAQSIQVRMGTSSERTDWIASSSLITKFASGYGRAYYTSLTVGSQIGSLTRLLSFDRPSTTCISHQNTKYSPQRGQSECNPFEYNHVYDIDATVTLHGSGFGGAPTSPNAAIGGTSSAQTYWIADSSVKCHHMAMSTIGTLPAKVSIQSYYGEMTGVFSSTLPDITGSIKSNAEALGNKMVLVGNLGPASMSFTIRFGGTHASATFWVSTTTMHVIPAAGHSNSDSRVCISVVQIVRSARSILSYDLQSLHTRNRGNTPHTGSYLISIMGTTFARHDFSHSNRMGVSSGEVSAWVSDTTVSCATAAGSLNLAGVSVVTIQESSGSITEAASFDLPQARSLLHSNLPGHRVETKSFTIFGQGLSVDLLTARMAIGGSSCAATQWRSYSSMACKHSIGVGFMRGLALSANPTGRASMSGVYSYDLAAIVEGNRMANSPPGVPESREAISRVLPFTGYNLLVSYSGAVRLGRTAALSTTWQSLTSMTAGVAAGVGIAHASAVTIAGQIGCATNLFTYDGGRLTLISPRNMPQYEAIAIEDGMPQYAPVERRVTARISLSGSNFGHHSSQQIRLQFSQCQTSTWLSDSSLACKRAAGISGRDLYLVVSIVAHTRNTLRALHSYDSPVIIDAAERLDEEQTTDLITLQGHSFGQSDYSLQAKIAQYGCTATTWLADTAMMCKLRPGVKAQEVPFADIRTGTVCRSCLPEETLIKCAGGSPGWCWVCEPCGPGLYRDCFPAKQDSSGECVQCPNDGYAIGERYYKDTVGDTDTQCSPCTVCGGRNQNGSEFEIQRCTPDTDAKCRPCPPCPDPQIRVGCGGEAQGDCMVIAPGVTRILGSAVGLLNGETRSQWLHVTEGPIVVKMTGDFEGTSLVLSERTSLAFPDKVMNLSLSAVEPSVEMMEATKDRVLLEGLYDLNATKSRRLLRFLTGSRRASENLTGLALKVVSNVLHCSPAGLILQPPATLTLQLIPAALADSNYANMVFVYAWDPDTNQWRRMDNGNDYLNVSNTTIGIWVSNFTTFVAMAPIDVNPPGGLELVVPAVVITLLVLGAGIVCFCWCQREYVLKRAGGLVPAKRPGDTYLVHSPATNYQQQYHFGVRPVSAVSTDLSSIGSPGVPGLVPPTELAQATHHDEGLHRLAEFRMTPVARSTRMALNKSDSTSPFYSPLSMPSAYLPRTMSPLESRSRSRSPQPRRSPARSPPAAAAAPISRGFSPAIEMSSATPRRKFSDVEISVVTPSRRERSGSRARMPSSERYRRSVDGEILQVATDYTDRQAMMPTRRQSLSPPGVWDIRPASQSQLSSVLETWGSHGRRGDSSTREGLVGSASDYSLAGGQASRAVRPGSAAAGMREQTSWQHQRRAATHTGIMRRPGPRRYSDSEDSNSDSDDGIYGRHVEQGSLAQSGTGQYDRQSHTGAGQYDVGPLPPRATDARLLPDNVQVFRGAPGSAAVRMRQHTSTSGGREALASRQPRQKRARTLVYDENSDDSDDRFQGQPVETGSGEARRGDSRGRSRSRRASFTQEFEA